MCEVFVAAATPFFYPPPRHFFSAGRPFLSAARPFRFFSFLFISEVVPQNPGHATHFTKGNENPLGNKLGGGPSGGAHEPPPASTREVCIQRVVTISGFCVFRFKGVSL